MLPQSARDINKRKIQSRIPSHAGLIACAGEKERERHGGCGVGPEEMIVSSRVVCRLSCNQAQSIQLASRRPQMKQDEKEPKGNDNQNKPI